METEGNKVLAEFMSIVEIKDKHESYGSYVDYYYTQYFSYRTLSYTIPDKSTTQFLNECKFSTSWDWLMPVWIKFRDLNIDRSVDSSTWFQLRIFRNKIQRILPNSNSPSDFFPHLVEAVKWYQSTKK